MWVANVVVVLCRKNCISVGRRFIIVEEGYASCLCFVQVCVGGFFWMSVCMCGFMAK